eukprot:TRINITY_DN27763_c0_g1_i2.p1 TRINITY_DN27763_c0_g1~~TRINITY_DN27763_c0_g1_i2.p1  ORF type:complete len:279 (-),score=28.52 TRINITY_DN27763_c0_g1_i2:449-1285(-)
MFVDSSSEGPVAGDRRDFSRGRSGDRSGDRRDRSRSRRRRSRSQRRSHSSRVARAVTCAVAGGATAGLPAESRSAPVALPRTLAKGCTWGLRPPPQPLRRGASPAASLAPYTTSTPRGARAEWQLKDLGSIQFGEQDEPVKDCIAHLDPGGIDELSISGDIWLEQLEEAPWWVAPAPPVLFDVSSSRLGARCEARRRDALPREAEILALPGLPSAADALSSDAFPVAPDRAAPPPVSGLSRPCFGACTTLTTCFPRQQRHPNLVASPPRLLHLEGRQL